MLMPWFFRKWDLLTWYFLSAFSVVCCHPTTGHSDTSWGSGVCEKCIWEPSHSYMTNSKENKQRCKQRGDTIEALLEALLLNLFFVSLSLPSIIIFLSFSLSYSQVMHTYIKTNITRDLLRSYIHTYTTRDLWDIPFACTQMYVTIIYNVSIKREREKERDDLDK